MHENTATAIRRAAALTAACVVASLVITEAVTYLVTGKSSPALALLLSVLAPAIIVPISAYAHISMAIRLREANNRLRVLSETDHLTQVCNRRRFLEIAEQQLSLARRHGYPTSVLLIDFDHFKQINDRRGHAAGDRVLVDSTAIVSDLLRESDTLARFGGEEFVVLLPHTGSAGASMVADRIAAALRTHTFRHEGADIEVTVSIGGVACESSGASLESMTSAADSLLYDCKQAGRDRCRVEVMPPDEPPRLRGVRGA